MLQKIKYGGWPNCYRYTNDSIEVVLTADVGPRIVYLGFVGQANVFNANLGDQGNMGGISWHHYGGHRLWHGPEVKPRTYYPDNWPIQVVEEGYQVRLIQPVEETTGVQKEIDLLFDPHSTHVRLTHRLRNTTLWPIKEISIWALTDVAAGGVEIMPLPARIVHDPDTFHAPHSLVIWDYTDMSDPRWTWGQRYLLLRDSKEIPSHQKMGMVVPDGWVAYAVHHNLFVKQFCSLPEAKYPDGCSGILFTNAGQSQLETKSPITCLEPQGIKEHVEDWYLFDGVPRPENDSDVERFVLPHLQTLLTASPSSSHPGSPNNGAGLP